MKINLKEKIKDIDGKEIDLTLGKALANFVLVVKSDPLRSYLLASKLATLDEIELEKADFTWIKDAVKENAMTIYSNALVAGQIINIFNDLKE
jgi:hypothetical protein